MSSPACGSTAHEGIAGACLAIWREACAISKVAAPLAAANLAQMAMGVTDTAMVGRLGGTPLAAAGLGAAAYFTVGTILQGMLLAVTPLAAHAHSAGDRDTLGRIAAAGLFVAAALTVPFIAILTGFAALLRIVGYDQSLAAEIGSFLKAIGWGAPALLGFGALRSLLTGLSRTTPIIALLALGLCVNAWLDWMLIFGNLGAPALGSAGSGYATAVTQWLMFLGLLAYPKRPTDLSRSHSFDRLIGRACPEIRQVFRLGLPIAGVIAIDVGLFGAVGVGMGLLGQDALAAQQVVLSTASFALMVPLGFAQAATVRVAIGLGADRHDLARRASIVSLGLSIAVMAAATIVLWTSAHAVIGFYVDLQNPTNREIIRIAESCLAVAAAFLIFDAVQVTAAGALRGYRDVRVPMLIATIGYWPVGFLGGWVLAFPLGYGAVGLWWGLALGLGVVALSLTIRLFRFSSMS